MTIVLSHLTDATRDALHQAAAALRRCKAVLAAATLSSDRAKQWFEHANARAHRLKAKMADVKHASRRRA